MTCWTRRVAVALLAVTALAVAAPADASWAWLRRITHSGVSAPAGSPVQMDTVCPLTSGTEGSTYTVTITASGGSGTGFTLTKTGTLPPGTSITSASNPMRISGTLTDGASQGVWVFGLTITDSLGGTTGASPISCAISVAYRTPTVDNSSLTAGSVDTVGCGGNTLVASGGPAPRTFTSISGMPPGCSLNTSSGAITGTPTASGTYTAVFETIDGIGTHSAPKSLPFSITSAPTGACSDALADALAGCLSEMNGVSAGGAPLVTFMRHLRDNGEIDDFTQNHLTNCATSISGFCYNYPDGTFAGDVNMAHAVIPQGDYGIAPAQLRFSQGAITSGTWFGMVEFYMPNEYSLGAQSCWGGGTPGNAPNQKAFQFTQLYPGGDNFAIQSNFKFQNADQTDGVGTVPGMSLVSGVTVTQLSASGQTASAVAANHGLSMGDPVTVIGSSVSTVLNIQSVGTGSPFTLTMTANHNLTGSGVTIGQIANVTGIAPTFQGVPNGQVSCTVSGAATLSCVRVLDGAAVTNGGTAATGTFTFYPYSRYRATVQSVADSSHFTYDILGGSPATTTASGIRAFGDINAGVTGTDCAVMDVRPLAKFYPDSSLGHLNTLANFIVTCKTVGRLSWVLAMNQGTAWTCGAVSGNREQLWMYGRMAGGSRVTLYAAEEFEFDFLGSTEHAQMTSANCATDTNITRTVVGSFRQVWNELDSSSGGCNGGAGIPRRLYLRNFSTVYSPTNITAGAIVPSATGVLVNGTEVVNIPVIP